MFHDALAASWNGHYARGGFRKRLALVRQILAQVVRPADRWLDAGCGAGVLTLELSRLGATGVAVDGSAHMIDAAVREASTLAGGFAFVRIQCLARLDLPAAAFDGILCSSVIEYVDDVDRVLLEFNRVLRVGGNLILSVPNAHSLVRVTQKGLRCLAAFISKEPFAYLAVSIHDFKKEEIVTRLSCCGFRVRSVQRLIHPPRGLSSLVPAALFFIVAEKAPDGSSATN